MASEIVPVSREALANALARGEILIDNPKPVDRAGAEPPRCSGHVSYPDAVAEELLGECANAFRAKLAGPPVLLPLLPEHDPEIAAMAAITGALTALDTDDPDMIPRILRWACARWEAS